MTDLAKTLDKFAASDLAKARREGEIFVCQTKQGTVAVRHDGGAYEIVRMGSPTQEPTVLAKGAPRTVRPVLAALYVVES